MMLFHGMREHSLPKLKATLIAANLHFKTALWLHRQPSHLLS